MALFETISSFVYCTFNCALNTFTASTFRCICICAANNVYRPFHLNSFCIFFTAGLDYGHSVIAIALLSCKSTLVRDSQSKYIFTHMGQSELLKQAGQSSVVINKGEYHSDSSMWFMFVERWEGWIVYQRHSCTLRLN